MRSSLRKNKSIFATLVEVLLLFSFTAAGASAQLAWQVSRGTQTFWILGASHHLLPKHEKVPVFLEHIYAKSSVIIPESIIFNNERMPKSTFTTTIAPSPYSVNLVSSLVNERRISIEHSNLLLETSVQEIQYHVDTVMDFVRPKDRIRTTYVEGF